MTGRPAMAAVVSDDIPSPPRASYDIAGPSDAPVIVFLHGTRLTRGIWTAQMSKLAEDYRVLAVDLPGHGAMAATPFTLETAADHAAAVIRSAAGGQAVVVGLSLGGYVGMVLAARHPTAVRGLVLSGASAEPMGWRAHPFRWFAAVMERWDGPRLRALDPWFFRTRYPPAIAEPIIAGGFWSAGGAIALRSLIGRTFVPILAGYAGPMLLINGEYDLFFRLSAGAFRRAAPDARWVRLRGATHLANLDRPAAFSLAVRRFMQALEAAPATRR